MYNVFLSFSYCYAYLPNIKGSTILKLATIHDTYSEALAAARDICHMGKVLITNQHGFFVCVDYLGVVREVSKARCF
jgi:hypothetical protein